MILRVFRVHKVYRGSFFSSLVPILPIPTYLGIKGDQFFQTSEIYSACLILRKIECNEFVCNKFVLVLVQIDLIQFEYSNCIRSICTKFDTNSLHTNLLHSILRKNRTISRKTKHMIQIVVHQFVRKSSAKKILKSEKNWSPFIPRYAGIRQISTKEKKIDPL